MFEVAGALVLYVILVKLEITLIFYVPDRFFLRDYILLKLLYYGIIRVNGVVGSYCVFVGND